MLLYNVKQFKFKVSKCFSYLKLLNQPPYISIQSSKHRNGASAGGAGGSKLALIYQSIARIVSAPRAARARLCTAPAPHTEQIKNQLRVCLWCYPDKGTDLIVKFKTACTESDFCLKR